MNTKTVTTTIIALVIGVVMIAGVMTPILASTLNSGGGSEDEPATEQTYTNLGAPCRNIVRMCEEYNLDYTFDQGTQKGTETAIELYFDESNVLHWWLRTVIYDGNWNPLETTTIIDAPIRQSGVLYMDAENVYAYDYDNNQVLFKLRSGEYDAYQGRGFGIVTPADYVPMKLWAETTIDAETETVHYIPVIRMFIDEDQDHIFDIMNMDATENSENYFYDLNGDMVSYAGDNLSFYYQSESTCYAYISEDIAGSTVPSMEGYIFTSYKAPEGDVSYEGSATSDIRQDDYVCSVEETPIKIGFERVTQTGGGSFTVDWDMRECNVYIVPAEVTGYLLPKSVHNSGTMMSSTQLIEEGAQFACGCYAGEDVAYLWVLPNNADEINIDVAEDTLLYISDTISIYYAHTLGLMYISYIDNGTLTNLAIIQSEMEDGSNIDFYISDQGCELTYPGTDNPISLDSGNGYFCNPAGDHVLVTSPTPVLYNNADQISYGHIEHSVDYWSNSTGLSSNLTVYAEDITTVSNPTLRGATDKGGYMQLSTTGSNGISVSVDGNSQTCNAYIVPYEILVQGGGSGGSNIDPTLASMITVIPLIMAVGLVIATVAIWKGQ